MKIIYSKKKNFRKRNLYEFIPFNPAPYIREIIPLTPPNTKDCNV